MNKKIFAVLFLLVFISQRSAAADTKTRLTLPDALAISLQEDKRAVKDALYNLETAKAGRRSAYAAYNLKSDISANYSKQQSDLSTTALSESLTSQLSASRVWPTFTGGQFTLSPTYTLSNLKNYITPSDIGSTTAALSATWSQPLTSAGIVSKNIGLKRADQNFEIAGLSYIKARQNIILNAVSAFYSVISNQRAAAIAKEQLKATDHLLDVSRAKLRAGLVPEFDTLRIKVQLASNKNDLAVAENNLRYSLDSLRAILQLPANIPLVPESEIDIEPFGKSLEEYTKEVLSDNLDIKTTRINLAQSKDNVLVAQSAYNPELSLASQHSWYNPYRGSSSDTRNWTLTAGISLLLIDDDSRASAIKSAAESLAGREVYLEQLEQDTVKEVARLYRTLNADIDRISILEASLALAKESLRISELKYQEGLLTIDDVLQTQLSLQNTASSLNSAKISYITGKATLLSKTSGELDKWTR